jgi:hypothetical protein
VSGANFGEKDRDPERRKHEQETHMIVFPRGYRNPILRRVIE